MGVGGFFGGVMIVIGAIITALCGLCTLAVIAFSLSAPPGTGSRDYGGGSMIPVALEVGGIPTAVGILLIVAGIFLIRATRRAASPPAGPGPGPAG